MRRSLLLLTLPALTLVAAAPARAGIPHTVAPGETLWQLAAAHNMTTRSFAAANGLAETANVVAGTTIQIPSVAEASAALTRIGITPAVPTTAPVATAPAPVAAPAPATRPPPPAPRRRACPRHGRPARPGRLHRPPRRHAQRAGRRRARPTRADG